MAVRLSLKTLLPGALLLGTAVGCPLVVGVRVTAAASASAGTPSAPPLPDDDRPAAADPADFLAEHASRRSKLSARLGDNAVAVVLGARDADSFRQIPAFRYLAGELEPDAILMLEPGNADRPETLYIKGRDLAQERWTGPTLSPGEIDPTTGEANDERRAAQLKTGVSAVRPLSAFDADLSRALGRGRVLHIDAAPVAAGQPGSAGLELVRSLRDRRATLEVAELAPALRELRMIKSEREVAAIRHACEVTMAAHRELAQAISPGRHEYETKALLEYVFRRSGAAVAFPSVVGSGGNAAVLHYRGERRAMRAGDLVVIDIGAEWDGYAADITRTWPVSGRFTAEQRAVYDTVLAAQNAAIAKIKPGARLRSDVHAAAVSVIDGAGYKGRFPHSTSHHLGLEVHDPGERDGVLRAGMVITVEPGIYLEDRAFGVRIEDVVRVTRDGHELLTADLPRTADEIEALMQPDSTAGDSAGKQRRREGIAE